METDTNTKTTSSVAILAVCQSPDLITNQPMRKVRINHTKTVSLNITVEIPDDLGSHDLLDLLNDFGEANGAVEDSYHITDYATSQI